MQLEVECSSGLRGTPPMADFKPAYRDVVAMLADKTWRAEHERLSEDPRRYRFLDAAQLVTSD